MKIHCTEDEWDTMRDIFFSKYNIDEDLMKTEYIDCVVYDDEHREILKIEVFYKV